MATGTQTQTRAATRSLFRLLGRGLGRRCPRCAQSKIFASWFRLLPECPGCGYRFEREEGYWVGAIIINTAVIEIIFGISFITTMVVTAPDIPWTPILVLALITNGLFPFFFYPFSKTVWMGVDLYFHPLRGDN